MRQLIFAISIISACFQQAWSLGCIPKVCRNNEPNEILGCQNTAGFCGTFNGKRPGNRLVKGVDIRCELNDEVYAPFNGTIRYYAPFRDGSCADSGLEIRGEGQWQGYIARVSYITPFMTGGHVKQGDPIGKAIGSSCITGSGSYGSHILFELFREGRVIDPTSHLRDCMCTGQICESNYNNALVQNYTVNRQFGKGFEIKCPEQLVIPYSNAPREKHINRAPFVYSPIEGQRLGRLRLREQGVEFDCTNDGVFIQGAESGRWKDYMVRIYNVQFYGTLGVRSIKQGDPIARRLTCTRGNSVTPSDSEPNTINSIFIEFLYHGRHVNLTEIVLGSNCKMPEH